MQQQARMGRWPWSTESDAKCTIPYKGTRRYDYRPKVSCPVLQPTTESAGASAEPRAATPRAAQGRAGTTPQASPLWPRTCLPLLCARCTAREGAAAKKSRSKRANIHTTTTPPLLYQNMYTLESNAAASVAKAPSSRAGDFRPTWTAACHEVARGPVRVGEIDRGRRQGPHRIVHTERAGTRCCVPNCPPT